MRGIRLLIVLLAVAPCARAATTGGTPAPSGVEGIVLLGPMCPVEMAASPCPDEPVAARVHVVGEGLDEMIRTDDRGRFRIVLEPGAYELQPMPRSDAGIRTGRPMSVTVRAEGFTRLTLTIDTGIR